MFSPQTPSTYLRYTLILAVCLIIIYLNATYWRNHRPHTAHPHSRTNPVKGPHTITLMEHLEREFPYDIHTEFPKTIWQTCKYSPASMRFDANSREGVNSWEKLHPEYAHQVLTDLHAKNLIEDVYRAIPQVLQVYKALPLPVLKADFFRYLILLAKGGVYSDIDTVALKSIPDWMPEWFQNDDVGLIVGIEADPNRADWDQWYSRRVQFCQWTILAKAGHPVLRRIVEKITMEGLQMIHNQTLTELKANDVVEFTGPGPWTDMVFSSMNTLSQEYDECISWRNFTGITEPKQVSDIIVLPITSLSPGCGHMGSKGIHDPSAFVQHKFKGKVHGSTEPYLTEASAEPSVGTYSLSYRRTHT